MSRIANRQGATIPIHLTIFADASFDSRSGAAGWGGWLKGAGLDRGVTCGGPLSALLRSSGEAEAQSLANVLSVAEHGGFLTEGAVVLLQCDNLEVLSTIRQRPGAEDRPAPHGLRVVMRRKRIKPGPLADAIEVINAIARRHSLRLIVRHVRGHQPGEGRNWVNRECDRLAKGGMQARRAELQKEST